VQAKPTHCTDGRLFQILLGKQGLFTLERKRQEDPFFRVCPVGLCPFSNAPILECAPTLPCYFSKRKKARPFFLFFLYPCSTQFIYVLLYKNFSFSFVSHLKVFNLTPIKVHETKPSQIFAAASPRSHEESAYDNAYKNMHVTVPLDEEEKEETCITIER
jgi:hypothetical protein